jgi:hypothetical protein
LPLIILATSSNQNNILSFGLENKKKMKKGSGREYKTLGLNPMEVY